MIEAAVLAGGLAGAEALTAMAVHVLRRTCPWIIVPKDLNPSIDRDGLRRFLDHGWDSELGWIRKPNTSHDEIGRNGTTTRYHIDGTGARVNPGFEYKPPAAIVYGDSYAFCRQVNDEETWPHLISKKLDRNIENRGVGNYGLDQAVLRMERELPARPAPVVVIAVVPETICRIMSVWRHFSEYGNVFAFKPRFTLLPDGQLDLLPNPAYKPERFLKISELLPSVKRDDFFYQHKFMTDILSFPYSWNLWRTRRRNLPLMFAAARDQLREDSRLAFCQVMERNIHIAASLYRETEPLELFLAILRRFAAFARQQGSRPLLAILPQLYELRRLRAGDWFYRPLIERAAPFLEVLDCGETLVSSGSESSSYIDDRFGGHLCAAGNRLIAERIGSALA